MTMSVLDWERSIRGKTLRVKDSDFKSSQEPKRRILLRERKKPESIDDYLKSKDEDSYIEDLHLTMNEFKHIVEIWKRKNLK